MTYADHTHQHTIPYLFPGIVDVKDMTLFQITRDFLALTRAIADVDQGQYPETLGMYLHGASTLCVW
ncbi:hypothetical protein EON63_21115 [archaeon]|nr:MAG: hypothetical protein EON63_21115 [archaeon]